MIYEHMLEKGLKAQFIRHKLVHNYDLFGDSKITAGWILTCLMSLPCLKSQDTIPRTR